MLDLPVLPAASPIAALGNLHFRPMQPDDLFAIDVQGSQATFLGLDAAPDEETALNLAAQPVAWAAVRDGAVLACFGINEAFPGKHGTAWALLGKDIGADHLALTRFVRQVVEGCTLDRLDVLAKSRDYGGGIRGMSAALADATTEVRWCLMLGFEPAHQLRKFGAAGETYMMLERIKDDAAGMAVADGEVKP